MQNHGDFIFHLDEPREQFESGRKKLRGWIASQETLGEIRLRGESFRREEADRIITLFAEIFPEAFVVQIGANDGSAGDPLAEAFSRTRWSGLLVEPVLHLCEALARQFRDRPNIAIERAAISS